MALAEDDDALAAEYVLGTLSVEERHIVDARRAADPEFARAVEAWERRLAPLAEMSPDVAPPAATFGALMARLDGAAPAASNVVALQHKLTLWRGATIALGALAASLLVLISLPRPPGGQFVAVLQSDRSQPGFVASVDTAHRTISVRRVGAAPPPSHSYELWALGAGRPAPQSLGIVDDRAVLPTKALSGHNPGETVLAISLEPAGGSPTGQPTGPVVYTGNLLPAD